jgi:hypothetical protein
LSSATADFRNSITNDQELTVVYVHWLGDPVYGHYHKQGNGDELENESDRSCHTALLAIRTLDGLGKSKHVSPSTIRNSRVLVLNLRDGLPRDANEGLRNDCLAMGFLALR